MQQKDKIKKIIKQLSKDINKVNDDQKVGRIVRQIDSLTQQCYIDLYKAVDPRENYNQQLEKSEKKGHCC